MKDWCYIYNRNSFWSTFCISTTKFHFKVEKKSLWGKLTFSKVRSTLRWYYCARKASLYEAFKESMWRWARPGTRKAKMSFACISMTEDLNTFSYFPLRLIGITWIKSLCYLNDSYNFFYRELFNLWPYHWVIFRSHYVYTPPKSRQN